MHDHALRPLVTLLATLALPASVLAADLEVTKVTETPGEGNSGTVCLITSADLEESPDLTKLRAFMSVRDLGSGQEAEISPFVRGQQLCATGFKAGGRYELSVKKGLRSSEGDTLAEDLKRTVLMSDLGASLSLEHGTLLPNTLSEGSLYLKSVNMKGVRVGLFRIPREDLLASGYAAKIFGDLDQWTFRDLIFNHASKLGETMLAPDVSTNETAYLEVKLSDLAGQKLQDGVYVLAAADASSHKTSGPEDSDYTESGHWLARVLIVSDLGVTAYRGERSLFVGVHSLKSANPVAGAKVTLLSRGNTELGSAQSDSSGFASFGADTLSGDFGDTPAAVSVSMGGDFFMLPLSSSSALDLSAFSEGFDPESASRTQEYPDLKSLVYTDRGIFRPGEKVNFTALIRTRDLKASDLNAVTLNITRPDGISMSRQTLSPKGAGFFEGEYALPDRAVHGNWTGELLLGDARLASVSFAVQDFIPQTLTAQAHDAALTAAVGSTLEVEAAYNYGAPAQGLEISAGITLSACDHPFNDAALRDYRFGPSQDESAAIISRRDFTGARLNDAGKAEFKFTPESRPFAMRATLLGNVFDGPSVIPFSRDYLVNPGVPLIGIRHDPKRDALSFVSLDAAGADSPQDLRVTLMKVVRDYQYVYEDHAWRFIRHEARLPLSSAVLGHAFLQDGVDLASLGDGEYLVKVRGMSGGESSLLFRKGYADDESAAMTPDLLTLTLDRDSYSHGQKAAVTLTVPQSGFVDLAFGTEKINSIRRYEVHQGENTLSFKLPADFREGAHLLAAFTAPTGDAPTPSRAFGLAYLKCADTVKALELKLDAPATARPGSTLEATLECPGDGPVFYTAALVDEGILNLTDAPEPDVLTRFLKPAPYGVEVHDLTGLMLRAFGKQGQGYGALDEMLGASASPSSIKSFNERIVALHQGVSELKDGKAALSFKLPEFDGGLKLMVAAASASSLGYASSQVKVHDAAPVSLSLPQVARAGDSFNTTLSLQNLESPGSRFDISLSCEGALRCAALKTTLDAARGASSAIPIEVTVPGTGEGTLRYEVHGADFDKRGEARITVLPASPEILVMSSAPVKSGSEVTLELTPQLMEGASVTASVGGLPYADRDAYRQLLLKPSVSMTPGEMALAVCALLRQSQSDSQNAVIQDLLDALQARFNAQGYADGVDAYSAALSFEAMKRGYDAGFAVSPELAGKLREVLRGYARDADSLSAAAPALKALAQAGHGNLAQLRYIFDRAQEVPPLAACALAQAFTLHGDFERAHKALAMAKPGLERRQALVAAVREAKGDKAYAEAMEALRDYENVSLSSAGFDTAAVAITAFDLKREELLGELDFTPFRDPASLSAGTAALLYDLSSHYPASQSVSAVPGADGRVTVENRTGTDAFATVRAFGFPVSVGTLAGNMQVKRSFLNEDGTPLKSPLDLKAHENVVMLVEVTRARTGGGATVSLALPTGFGFLKALAAAEDSPSGETLYPSAVQNGDTGMSLDFDYLPYDSRVLRFALVVRPDLEGTFTLPYLQIRESDAADTCIWREDDPSLRVSR